MSLLLISDLLSSSFLSRAIDTSVNNSAIYWMVLCESRAICLWTVWICGKNVSKIQMCGWWSTNAESRFTNKIFNFTNGFLFYKSKIIYLQINIYLWKPTHKLQIGNLYLWIAKRVCNSRHICRSPSVHLQLFLRQIQAHRIMAEWVMLSLITVFGVMKVAVFGYITMVT